MSRTTCCGRSVKEPKLRTSLPCSSTNSKTCREWSTHLRITSWCGQNVIPDIWLSRWKLDHSFPQNQLVALYLHRKTHPSTNFLLDVAPFAILKKPQNYRSIYLIILSQGHVTQLQIQSDDWDWLPGSWSHLSYSVNTINHDWILNIVEYLTVSKYETKSERGRHKTITTVCVA